jgi:hypothetical protein
VPGPKAILSYLPRRADLADQSVRLPRSTRTIWKVLCRNDRILQALCTTTGVAFAVGRLGSAVQLHHDARGNRALP